MDDERQSPAHFCEFGGLLERAIRISRKNQEWVAEKAQTIAHDTRALNTARRLRSVVTAADQDVAELPDLDPKHLRSAVAAITGWDESVRYRRLKDLIVRHGCRRAADIVEQLLEQELGAPVMAHNLRRFGLEADCQVSMGPSRTPFQAHPAGRSTVVDPKHKDDQ